MSTKKVLHLGGPFHNDVKALDLGHGLTSEAHFDGLVVDEPYEQFNAGSLAFPATELPRKARARYLLQSYRRNADDMTRVFLALYQGDG